jgi:hypothetical protein
MDHQLCAYIEIPKGSRNKYEWDDDLQELVLDRFLPLVVDGVSNGRNRRITHWPERS